MSAERSLSERVQRAAEAKEAEKEAARAERVAAQLEADRIAAEEKAERRDAREAEADAAAIAAAEGRGEVEVKGKQIVPLTAVQLRRRRRRRLIWRFAILTGLPTLLAIVYFAFIAAPQYDSNVVIAVESNEGRAAASGKGSNAGNQRDGKELREYLVSHDALALLDKDHVFRIAYRHPGHDLLARLSPKASPQKIYKYFRSKVAATNDADAGIVRLRVRAFAPETAQKFANQLVDFAKSWVDAQNAASRQAALDPAQKAVDDARAALVKAAATAETALAGVPADERRSKPEEIDRDLAARNLELSLANLQTVELELGRAQRYLVVIDPPDLPDTATVPKPVWSILTVFFSALVLTSILSLLLAAVREHAHF